MKTGSRKRMFADSTARRGLRQKIHCSRMLVGPGFRSCPRRSFGRRVDTYLGSKNSAYAGALVFKVPPRPSCMTSAVLYGKDSPVKLPCSYPGTVTKQLWFIKRNLTPLKPSSCKACRHEAGSSFKTGGIHRREMPQKSGRDAACDLLSGNNSNAERVANCVHSTGLTGGVVNRRMASRSEKPTVKHVAETCGRWKTAVLLPFASGQGQTQGFVYLNQRVTCSSAYKGPARTPAIAPLAAL